MDNIHNIHEYLYNRHYTGDSRRILYYGDKNRYSSVNKTAKPSCRRLSVIFYTRNVQANDKKYGKCHFQTFHFFICICACGL